MIGLGVNLDHIATLRQLRGTPYPDLLEAARIVERAGGNQITVHLREDRRHINDADVWALRKKLKVPMNLEMAATDSIIRIATRLRPDWVCLVPEKRREVTTEGGLDVISQKRHVGQAIKRLKKAGIRVSLFIEPDFETVGLSWELGADAVELHTGRYCLATQKAFGSRSASLAKLELGRIRDAALFGQDAGLEVHAGHGFDYENVRPVAKLKNLRRQPLVTEYNIGHSIICRAAIVGLDRAVREMVAAIRKP